MRAIQSTQSRPSTHSIDTTESKKTGRIIEKALKEAVEDGDIPDVKQVCLEDFNSYSGYLSVVVKGKQGTFDYRYYLLGNDKDFNLRTVTSPVRKILRRLEKQHGLQAEITGVPKRKYKSVYGRKKYIGYDYNIITIDYWVR